MVVVFGIAVPIVALVALSGISDVYLVGETSPPAPGSTGMTINVIGWVVPAVLFVITRRWCRALQAPERRARVDRSRSGPPCGAQPRPGEYL
jgi:uncharacterized membrane protein